MGASFYYSWAGFGLAIGITLVVSWISWRFIEEPIAKLKDKILA
jgi:peptidoglycan/LPS O-acetylase OafA/YrhL